MPDLSAKQIGSAQSLLHRLCPVLGTTLTEQLNTETVLELLEVQVVPLSDLLGRTDRVLQTLFTFSQTEGSESAFLVSEETARLFVALIEGKPANPQDELTDAQVDHLSGAMNALVRGLGSGLTALTEQPFDIESSLTHVGLLTVPPVFALDGTAIEVKYAVSTGDGTTSELTGLFTTTVLAELAPFGEALSPEDAASEAADAMSADDVAAMLSQVTGSGDDFSPGQTSAPTLGLGGGYGGSIGSAPTRLSDSNYPHGLEMILDIPLDVTVELGRVRMLIKDVLELSGGSIIELDRVAGEPVDLLVNGRLVAKGEVVVIEDNFGIRITEIVSPAERVAGLGKGR